MATRFPALLYLRTDKICERLSITAERAGIEFADMVAAVSRSPTLLAREPVMLARRIRLGARIAAALGQPLSAREVLEANPAIPTYAMDRLLVRWLIARLGLWKGGFLSLIVQTDRQCGDLLQEYAEAHLPEHDKNKIKAIMAKRSM
jgi:hypothetical protein